MTRGAKIVVFSIVGLFVLAGMYFTFFAPAVPSEPLADTTPTVSESEALTLAPGDSPAFAPTAFGVVNDPTAVPAAQAVTTGFPVSADTAFAPSTTPTAPSWNVNPEVPAVVPPVTVTVSEPAVQGTEVVTNSPAPKVVEKTVAKATNYTSYTVVSGDTLSSIAGVWFRDTSKWQLIADANPGLKPSTLKVGQKINLPAKSGKAAAQTASSVKANPALSTGDQHVVASGETLASISDKAYGNRNNWKRIYEANKGVIGSDPSRLKVGMKLTIPAKS